MSKVENSSAKSSAKEAARISQLGLVNFPNRTPDIGSIYMESNTFLSTRLTSIGLALASWGPNFLIRFPKVTCLWYI